MKDSMPVSPDDRDHFNKEYRRTLAIYDGDFTAIWECGVGLQNSIGKRGAGVSLEAEVFFKDGLEEESLKRVFANTRVDARKNLRNISARIDLQSLVENRTISLRHTYQENGNTVQITPEMLKRLVIGNVLPHAVIGEIAMIVDNAVLHKHQPTMPVTNKPNETPVLDDFKKQAKEYHQITVPKIDWRLAFPDLQNFIQQVNAIIPHPNPYYDHSSNLYVS